MLQSLSAAGDPAATLRDIHLPPPPSWWPPAPGWWLLATMLLGVVLWLALRALTVWRRRQRIAMILRAFDRDTATHDDPAAALLAASGYLRRAARLRDADASQLEGEAWLRFLDGDNAATTFSTGMGRVLVDGAFQSSVDVDAARGALVVARQRLCSLLEAGHA